VLRNKNQPLTARSVALKLLLQSTDSRAIEAISDIIRSEDEHTELRMEAIRGVGQRRVGIIEAVDALVHALGDEMRRIRQIAAEALGDFGDASAIEALIMVLYQEDQDTGTKSAVVSALGKFKASSAHASRAMNILINVLETRSHEEKVRAIAAWNLGGFTQHESISLLTRTATSEDEPQAVREAAIEALAHVAFEKAEESTAFSRLQPSGSYILTPEIYSRDWDKVKERFSQYRHYREAIADRLPQGAKEYALGAYHNSFERESPHDSWLEGLRMEVSSTGDRSQYRTLDIHVRLLGSYHDGYIDFHYRNVHDYLLVGGDEWAYDEVRLGSEANVIHEIRFLGGNHWLIECEDFTYEWKPFNK